jgi:DNA-binding NtrC family response regulator
MNAVSGMYPESQSVPSKKTLAKSILLVDSDLDLRLMLRMLLSEEGHQVHTCGNLREALQAITERRFDFIITTHSTSGINGLSLLERIGHQDASVPVLIISERCELEPYLIAMNLGVLDYLTSPIDYAAIQRLVHGSRSERSQTKQGDRDRL